MRIYLAAPWIRRLDAKAEAVRFREAGHEITSRWHDEWANADTEDPILLAQEAAYDVDDVLRAEVMVVLNWVKSEGKAVEQGIAHITGMAIVVVGKPRGAPKWQTNVFHYLPNVVHMDGVEEALAWLRELP